jgi:mannose-6-phosphate isomerase
VSSSLASWFRDSSLPLWSGAGFDRAARRFEEQLTFEGRPVETAMMRLMVQARQIATFARAAVDLGYGEADLVIDAYAAMKARYRGADGGDGWVFSVSRDGAVTDGTRDLYAHAFVIFAAAWMHRLTGDAAYLQDADGVLVIIERLFSHPPGYRTRLPDSNDQRSQNPHMHLLEALLALAETSGRDEHLAGAARLVDLFHSAMTRNEAAIVHEFYGRDWGALSPAGFNRFEPGHQFEWAWLLREYARLSGAAVDQSCTGLVTHALEWGVDTTNGVVFDSVLESGREAARTTRVWTHTEAIRCLSRAPDAERHAQLVGLIEQRLMSQHLPDHLRGGWYDRRDGEGVVIGGAMPASTLYHIAGAVFDTASQRRPVGSPPPWRVQISSE